jgi:UDP-N-acetylmuramate dehydrogenase
LEEMTLNDRLSQLDRKQRTLHEAIAARFRESFGDSFQLDQPLSRYTTAGIGGLADFLVTVRSAAELAEALILAVRQHIPCWILGAGSNVLVSDSGMRGLVIRNKAQHVHYRHDGLGVVLRAESGANLSSLARQSASRGLAGLEWAVGIPGTVGGAVVGNAGAHGSDIARSLRMATVLDADLKTRDYRPEELGFAYRSSALKRAHKGQGESNRAILAAEFELQPAPVEELEARVAEIVAHRKASQPPGASMGCMFKNPEGDHAGRLMHQAGLKGTRIGGAEISSVHANFFVNHGDASAEDVRQLMAEAWHVVNDRFGVELEPEVELIGDWD